MAPTTLPPFAPFPSAAWKELLSIEEWNASLQAWLSLAEAHTALPDSKFLKQTIHDESVTSFLSSFMREVAAYGPSMLGTSDSAKLLLKQCLMLTSKVLKSPQSPISLLQWEFLSDLSRVYGKRRANSALSALPEKSQNAVDTSLSALKKSLIKDLDAGINGDLKVVEVRLQRLNHLINASPSTSAFFLAGSEFLDGLITCYKVMNPPLRRTIITTTYLSLVGLTESEPPKFAMLTDQLYSLKTAAEAHKAGPLNVNDSLVADLVSTTPLLQQFEHKIGASSAAHARIQSVLRELAAFKKPGVGLKPNRLVRHKIDKGKGVALQDQNAMAGEVHIHYMSQITQVQDLFPELGSGFVSRLLDEYGNDTEQVIAHLLEDSLPAYLKEADRSEQLYASNYTFSRSSLMQVANMFADPRIPNQDENPVLYHG